jgi:hypothetical protein
MLHAAFLIRLLLHSKDKDSEMSAYFHRTTWLYIPEYGTFHLPPLTSKIAFLPGYICKV